MSVDRVTLARRIAASFGTSQKTLTVAEAVDAWTAKSESEEARRRRNLAEAESSEIDAQIKRGKFMPRSLHHHVVADLGAQTRTRIASARYISKEARVKLGKEIAAIEPIDPK
jgi:hypothetical protein